MKKSEKIKLTIFLFLSFILILGIIFALNGYIDFSTPKNKYKFTVPESKEEIIERCKDKELSDTVSCLVANVRTFYKYNITPDSVTLSFDELKEKGGDCRDYSLLYEELGNRLGLKSHIILLDYKKGEDHQIIILEDEKEYCVLDMLYYQCFKYGAYQ